ncbi:hypothetical protein [Nocardia brasiliensis]|uniref:hypothetical protein n=1 Tax=Nocardia brasiliensis TaxID=37326 RepID=UPI002453C5DB|nr:hypothetical protein [Nocardia brasiliensis]
MTDPTTRLRDALADYAKGDIHAQDWTPEACAAVFAAAGIEIPADRRKAVERIFRQTPFSAGNFTLDAKRLLRAAEVQS